LNWGLLGPYCLGGGIWGVTLDSHEPNGFGVSNSHLDTKRLEGRGFTVATGTPKLPLKGRKIEKSRLAK